MSALMLATQALVGSGRSRRRGHAAVAEPGRDSEDPRRDGRLRGARTSAREGWTLDLDRLLAALTPGTRALYINSPNNPTGWTIDARRPTRDPRALPPARHLDRRRRCLRAPLLRRCGTNPCAVVPRSLRAGGSRHQHQHVLQVLADDRLAARLDRGAAGADAGSRQADRVQHLLRAAVRAARGRRRRRRRARRWSRTPRSGFARGARFPGAAAARAAGRRGGARRRARCTRSSASTASPTASTSASASSPRRGLGLAPGIAFGPEGEGFVRWCFAASEARLADGVVRLARALEPARA